ncbi:methyltransferase [Massilia atriviolacea]|uniref:Methyltransferase domain-containing protein n=1 Tax=Massilia atriviolacea TaxID=2495579 RepID=A0A430HTF2_9BURK|nr:methyltransferase [Massilia atriviolacea]RSZ60833.1 methyltransferase domain-containing protein [Massilia atriviolacea]
MQTSTPVSTVKIDQWQRKRQQGFKSVPGAGRTITYLGKAFHVYPDTFWPFLDSQPLVRAMRIAPGQSVLDVGTGSGVIAVFAGLGGASRVLAVDINPAAIRSARRNARQHGVDSVMEVRRSDLFDEVGDERFDVITANLPFRNKPAPDVVARSQWDTGFQTNTRFFEQVGAHLKPGGRVYFAHANFGEVDLVRRLARQAGMRVRLLASSVPGEAEERQFHVFLIKPAASA